MNATHFISLFCVFFTAVSLLTFCSKQADVSELPAIHNEKGNHDDHEDESEEIELSAAQFTQADIVIGNAELRFIGKAILVNGQIDVPPQSNVSISIPYGGFIKKIELLPGSRVKKGDTLVVVENPEFIQFQQEYGESMANRDYLKAEFERQEKLFQDNVASGKNYQQAKGAYLANEIRIKSMAEHLRLIGFNPADQKNGNISASVSLLSPVSGTVRDVLVNLGKFAGPQDAILNITNAEDLHVELTVYENEASNLQEGQRIRFSLTNKPDEWREATVFLVGSTVREDRSVTVHGHLNRPYPDLKPGMFVTASIETGRVARLSVPIEAIVQVENQSFVFIHEKELDDNNTLSHHFTMIEVETGFSDGEFIHLTPTESSLDLKTKAIVIKGAFSVLAALKNTENEGHAH
jgi:cobalt-zinc-cadmium efflux system membrane fusion protein